MQIIPADTRSVEDIMSADGCSKRTAQRRRRDRPAKSLGRPVEIDYEHMDKLLRPYLSIPLDRKSATRISKIVQRKNGDIGCNQITVYSRLMILLA